MVPGSGAAFSARLTCTSLPSPGLSKRYCNHGPAPPHCDGPPGAASCPDNRHRVCTKEADEKENLLYLPTENQYVWADKPRVLWQSMIYFPGGRLMVLRHSRAGKGLRARLVWHSHFTDGYAEAREGRCELVRGHVLEAWSTESWGSGASHPIVNFFPEKFNIFFLFWISKQSITVITCRTPWLFQTKIYKETFGSLKYFVLSLCDHIPLSLSTSSKKREGVDLTVTMLYLFCLGLLFLICCLGYQDSGLGKVVSVLQALERWQKRSRFIWDTLLLTGPETTSFSCRGPGGTSVSPACLLFNPALSSGRPVSLL